MKNNEIASEALFKIMVLFLRITKKFHELEKVSIDIGEGEKLYPSELHVIEAVGNGYGNKVTVLSEKFGITKGAVSQVVNKLYEKGFINKERNEKYGKEIIISLTEKGWTAFELQDEWHKRMETEFIDYLETFTPEKIDSFLQILGKMEDFIDTFLREME